MTDQPDLSTLYGQLCAELGDLDYRLELMQKQRAELIERIRALNVLNGMKAQGLTPTKGYIRPIEAPND